MKTSMIGQFVTEQRLPWLAALIAGLLAIWVVVQSHGHINSDGVLYVESARLIAQGEFRQGFDLYKWPLYPSLMAAVHLVSGFSLQVSAHALAVVFFALAVAGMARLVRELGGDRDVMACAAGLMLCSSYLVSDILPIVVRDHGFWALHLWSLVFFARFYQSPAWPAALLWGLCAIFAMLFRIEGVTYLVMLPLLLLVKPQLSWLKRCHALARAHGLLLVAVLAVLLAFWLAPSLNMQSFGRLGDPYHVALNAYQQAVQGLMKKSDIYTREVLGDFLKGAALPGLLLTLLFALLSKMATSAGWAQLLLAGNAAVNRVLSRQPLARQLLGWLLMLGTLNGVFIILSTFLLPKRYMLPIGFVLIVYGAFGLSAMIRRRQQLRSAMLAIVMVLVVVQFGLIVKPSAQDFEISAVNWVQSQPAGGGRVYYDSATLRHYANAPNLPLRRDYPDAEIRRMVESGEVWSYQYMLVHASQKRPWAENYLTSRLGNAPAMVFDNGHSNRVLIYRVGKQG